MIEPQSEQDGASCWKRIGAPVLMFGASASLGGMMKPTIGVTDDALRLADDDESAALWARESRKAKSFGVGGARLDAAGVPLRSGSSRRFTPALAWVSVGMVLIAKNLEICTLLYFS